MRDLTATSAGSLANSHTVVSQVTSWLGSELLASLPAEGGYLEWDADDRTRSKGQLVLPDLDPTTGRWWMPPPPDVHAPTTDPATRHPAQALGQRAHICRGLTRPDGVTELVPLGWQRLEDWTHDPEARTVTITTVGLLADVDDAELAGPFQVPGGTSYQDAMVAALDGILPVWFDPALPVRTVGNGRTFESTNRLDVLLELADTWPADLDVDSQGVVRVTPSGGTGDTLRLGPTWTPEGPAGPSDSGTLLVRPSSAGRAGIHNAYVVRGEGTDPERSPVTGTAAQLDGPLAYGGPFGRVVGTFSSQFITTNGQADAVAQRMLDTDLARLQAYQALTIPDPRPELFDAIVVAGGYLSNGPENLFQGTAYPGYRAEDQAIYPLEVAGTLRRIRLPLDATRMTMELAPW